MRLVQGQQGHRDCTHEGHVGQRRGVDVGAPAALRRDVVVPARRSRLQQRLPGVVEHWQIGAALGIDVSDRLMGGILAHLRHDVVAGFAVAHSDRDARGADGGDPVHGRRRGRLLENHPVAEDGREAEGGRRRRRWWPPRLCRGERRGSRRRRQKEPDPRAHGGLTGGWRRPSVGSLVEISEIFAHGGLVLLVRQLALSAEARPCVAADGCRAAPAPLARGALRERRSLLTALQRRTTAGCQSRRGGVIQSVAESSCGC